MTVAAIELIGRLILQVVVPLLRGDTSVLQKKVGDILPKKLQTTVAHEAAEERARRKFGG